MILLDYSLKVSTIKNGGNYWDSNLCEIYKGQEKIGEYIRNYPSCSKETFFAFSLNEKEYALYSANYSKIQLMSLPDCKEIILDEECQNQMSRFCPSELYVPAWEYEKGYQTYINKLNDNKEYEYGYSSIGLSLGCVWGDDSSSKLMLIDLSEIENGKMWFVDNALDKKWLYSEFPDSLSLKDVEFIFDEENKTLIPTGYKQLIQNYIWFPNN